MERGLCCAHRSGIIAMRWLSKMHSVTFHTTVRKTPWSLLWTTTSHDTSKTKLWEEGCGSNRGYLTHRRFLPRKKGRRQSKTRDRWINRIKRPGADTSSSFQSQHQRVSRTARQNRSPISQVTEEEEKFITDDASPLRKQCTKLPTDCPENFRPNWTSPKVWEKALAMQWYASPCVASQHSAVKLALRKILGGGEIGRQ